MYFSFVRPSHLLTFFELRVKLMLRDRLFSQLQAKRGFIGTTLIWLFLVWSHKSSLRFWRCIISIFFEAVVIDYILLFQMQTFDCYFLPFYFKKLLSLNFGVLFLFFDKNWNFEESNGNGLHSLVKKESLTHFCE